MKKALSVYIPVRILASLAAFVAYAGIPAQPTVTAGGYVKPTYAPMFEVLFGVWERGDSLWYFHIARDGYSANTPDSVFMPLYPLLVSAAHHILFLPLILAGLLVSNFAFFFALVGFIKLAEHELDANAAERATWYFALFPGAFFFMVPYTEALFAGLAIWSFYFARTEKWGPAAATGLALSLTRNLGVMIALPLFLEFFSRYLGQKWRKHVRSGVSLLGIGLGPLILMAYFYHVEGNAIAWISNQGNWQRQATAPWTTLYLGAKQAWDYSGGYPGAVYTLEAATVFSILAVLVWGAVGRRAIGWPYFLFVILLLTPPLLAPYPGRYFMCFIRFAAVLFPVALILGERIHTKSVDTGLRLIFAGLYAICTSLFVANQNIF